MASKINPDTFDSALNAFLTTPSAWGALLIAGLFIYFWRKDVSNPQRSASTAVLSGAVENAVSAYSMAKQAQDDARECRRENQLMFDYIRELQRTMSDAGIPVPKMPEELWRS